MQTIGERLEEARKRKGVSIREAAETTKIRGDYLQKFEANSFEIDLPPLYLRGFLRTYAKFLELDAERLVADIDAAQGREGKPQKREQKEALGRVDFSGGEARTPESADTGNSKPGRFPHDQAALIKLGMIAGGVVIAVVVVILLINVIFTRSPAKTPDQPQTTPTPSVQADPIQTLVLTAVEPTRIKVVQDLDKVELFAGQLGRGEAKSFKKLGKLLITVESGKNIRMEVNGRSYPVPVDGYGRFALD